MHWSQEYVGMRYEPGVFDCGALVEKVQREVFSRNIVAPSDRDYLEAEGVLGKFRAMSDQIQRLKDSYVIPTDAPVDGDAILLKVRGYFQHLGLLCVIGGDKWILHASDLHGQVVLHRLRELEIRGMTVEGYYKWK